MGPRSWRFTKWENRPQPWVRCVIGADLVLFWGADPAVSHPRHFERYSVDCEGMFVPRGRADRKVIVIDRQPSASSELADQFIQIPPNREMEVIASLRMLLAGKSLDTNVDLGLDLSTLEALAADLKSCRYGAVFFGLGLAQLPVGHAHVIALLSLVADLNDHTRFVARRLRIPGDVAGADSALCWQTGFAYAVNFSRGYPRYNPDEYTAENLLANREVDACLLLGSESVPLLSAAARQQLASIETVALDYPHLDRTFAANVHFTTAVYGIHAPGPPIEWMRSPFRCGHWSTVTCRPMLTCWRRLFAESEALNDLTLQSHASLLLNRDP